MNNLLLSGLPHTWLFDLDGTLLKHNGHLGAGDVILPGVKEFWLKIPVDDSIILLSAREEKYRATTEAVLAEHELRFDVLIMGLPKGERILVNDKKPRGLATSISVNVERDAGLKGISIITSEVI